jgi:hypothetical protein
MKTSSSTQLTKTRLIDFSNVSSSPKKKSIVWDLLVFKPNMVRIYIFLKFLPHDGFFYMKSNEFSLSNLDLAANSNTCITHCAYRLKTSTYAFAQA